MSKAFAIVLLLLIASCCTCSRNAQPLVGGSSQQGNGTMVGCIVSTNGSAATNTRIRVRPTRYLKEPHGGVSGGDTLFDALTDSAGTFSISGISPGTYMVEANDGISSAVLMPATMNTQKDSVNLGTFNLKHHASIQGTYHDSAMNGASAVYVQVRGLERLLTIESGDTFLIDDLPEGKYDLRFADADSLAKSIVYSGIHVNAADTASVAVGTGWSYARRIRLNTTETGADITTDITNFPILIRLSANTFDFDQAKNDGSDIRFTNSDNASLAYEIEKWDAPNRLAHVWVKVDTIHGGDSLQSITLHWGNPYAADHSDPSAVFDTGDGFAGVWHLGEIGDSVYDATGNNYDGIDSGAATERGIIGDARRFTGGQHVKIPGLLDSPSSVTLSAWVRSDESAGGQEIISIGDAVLIRLNDINEGTSGSFHSDSLDDVTAYTPAGSKQTLANSGWHFLAYTIDRANHTQTLYIDGIQSATTYKDSPIVYAAIGTDTYIGKHGNGKTIFNFVGQIDDVRVKDISVSPAWIKLCYESQKENGLLVVW